MASKAESISSTSDVGDDGAEEQGDRLMITLFIWAPLKGGYRLRIAVEDLSTAICCAVESTLELSSLVDTASIFGEVNELMWFGLTIVEGEFRVGKCSQRPYAIHCIDTLRPVRVDVNIPRTMSGT
jgi:hypothetical protein